MRRKVNVVVITVALVCCSFFTRAQNESNFHFENLSYSFGLGAFPYGLKSVPIQSKTYISEFNHTVSPLLGVSYHFKEENVGVFADVSLGQQFRSTEWIPFDVFNGKIENRTVHSFYSKSNSYNVGLLFGNEIVKGFELYGKFGVGQSFHDYEIFYTPSLGPGVGRDEKTSSLNFQAGLEVKYYPFKLMGVSGSLSISDNFPVYSIRIIGKLLNLKKDKE
jgi:hypothetical protein